MLMVLGLAAFLVLAGSAVPGVVMLVTAGALSASRRWRRPGVIALCAGLSGTALVLLGLLVLSLLMQAQVTAETWWLFASGWGALISLGFACPPWSAAVTEPVGWSEPECQCLTARC